MASFKFDPRAGRARIHFRHDGRQYNRTLQVASAREAERACAVVEETVSDLRRGKLVLPEGADVADFVVSGGKLVRAQEPSRADRPIDARLTELLAAYQACPPPHLETSTRRMQRTHFRRLLEVLSDADLGKLDRAAAQDYIARRSKQAFRGRPIHRDTIHKELKTLRQAWIWVAQQRAKDGFPAPSWALKDLSFPKAREALPFMSWREIESEVARGGLSDAEATRLWSALWLDRQQVRDLLEYVQEAAGPGFLSPAIAAAAFTGCRRSELFRSRVGDWRLKEGVVKLRQKKRDRDKTFSFRDVPVHPELSAIMRGWFAAHSGGQYAFCQQDGSRLSWDEATHHFKRVLRGSKWCVVRGWHVLRHSFASNLAAAGVDQRKIDAWMGHSTEIRLRYQHLRPEDQQEAISIL